jgi:hypothetical protein
MTDDSFSGPCAPTATEDADGTPLPPLAELDWSLLAETPLIFGGVGAVNRPLARNLARLGMRRCVVLDRKEYGLQSVVSQCQSHEVGRRKVDVVADELADLDVTSVALHGDIEELHPGYLQPPALFVAAFDNRRADICANRLAISMGCRLAKVNVEPLFLTSSVRFYDLRPSPVEVCVECQFTETHYADQHHPQSCDAPSPERPTGSPRALCELAAGAAALAIAQVIASPAHWAPTWLGRQWQLNLLGGAATWSMLTPKSECRASHAMRWPEPRRLFHSPATLTLRELVAAAGMSPDRCWFSGPVSMATQLRCSGCGVDRSALRWLTRLDVAQGTCPCGGDLYAMPFFNRDRLQPRDVFPWLDTPLAELGLAEQMLVALDDEQVSRTFLLGSA